MTRYKSEAVASGRDWYPAAVLALLIVALTCGGSSSSPISAGIVRICAVPVLAVGLWRMAQGRASHAAAWPLWLLAAAAALIAAQCIPLPPGLWSELPGHRTVVDAYRAAEIPLPWLPISLTPAATWDALLGLTPPAAMLVATLTLGDRDRRLVAAGVLVVALASVGLGMLQLAGGEHSPLRIYAVTNANSAVGFFANRNHFSGFLATTLPLAAYLATRWARQAPAFSLLWIAAGLAVGAIDAVGAASTGSRAGLLLVLIGAAASVMVILRARARSSAPRWRFAALAAPAGLALCAIGLIVLAVNPRLEHRVQARTGPELRFELNPQVAKVGLDFAPFGSGAGSFAAVYQMYEPVSSMGPAFVNHAHDDFIEVWLEAGVAGVTLIVAFLVWWVTATWSRLQGRRGDRGAALALAGSFVVGMLLVHSLVDYPLRTPALITLFAFACGLIVPCRGENGGGPGAS
ncbi:MAG TPA: O-antigen ligase family protein [Caulobacteraceae bacterium]